MAASPPTWNSLSRGGEASPVVRRVGKGGQSCSRQQRCEPASPTFIACLTPCPWPRIGREGSENAAIADDERHALLSAADPAETTHAKIAASNRMAPPMDCQVCQG
jgi:hypothetical protein